MVLRHECAVLRTIKGVLAAGAEPVRPPARPRTPPTRRPCMDSRCCSPIGSPSTFAFLPGPEPAASRLRRGSRSRLCGDHEMSSPGAVECQYS